MISDKLPAVVQPIAKAVAALVAPWIVFALAWLVNRTGIELPIDPPMIETAVASAIAAAFVWWRENGNDPEAFARWAAKGVAAFVAPFVAAVATWAADALGVELPAGATYSDLLTFAVVGSVLVFATRNRDRVPSGLPVHGAT